MITINNIDYNYTYQKLTQIIDDTIGLYLIIKKDNKNRAKLTVKTILTSLQKRDFDTFYKYYEIFKTTLFNIKSSNLLDNEQINIREVAFGLLTQVKLILDDDFNIKKDVVEKQFCTVNNNEKPFYLFKTTDSDTFINDYSQIENNQEFKQYSCKIVCECASEFLKKYF